MKTVSFFIYGWGISCYNAFAVVYTTKEDEMKKDLVKIVTIGGGSSYTPELVEGFIRRYDELPVGELWLVDIEEGREKLEIVGALAQRMVKKAGLPMKVILSYDRREALKDADFVTTQMRIGRLPARVLDEWTGNQRGRGNV